MAELESAGDCPVCQSGAIEDGSFMEDPFFCPTAPYEKSSQLADVFESDDFKTFLRDICGEELVDTGIGLSMDDFQFNMSYDDIDIDSTTDLSLMDLSLPPLPIIAAYDSTPTGGNEACGMHSDEELNVHSTLDRTTSTSESTGTSDRRTANEDKEHISSSLIAKRKEKLREFPSALAEAFNIGDMDRLTELICEVMSDHCVFKSPASDEELEGRQHIINFYSELLKDYPDGVMAVKDVTWINRNEFRFRRYFHGTLINVSRKLQSRLYARNSVMHHLKLSKYTTEDIRAIAKKEQECSESDTPIRIFVKSEGRLSLNRLYFVNKYTIEYTITSFEVVKEDDADAVTFTTGTQPSQSEPAVETDTDKEDKEDREIKKEWSAEVDRAEEIEGQEKEGEER